MPVPILERSSRPLRELTATPFGEKAREVIRSLYRRERIDQRLGCRVMISLCEPPAPEGPAMASSPPSHVEAASTLAVIASSNEPLLFLSEDLKLIAASASFCRAFGIAPATVPGRSLADLGQGEWGASIASRMALTPPLACYVRLEMLPRRAPPSGTRMI